MTYTTQDLRPITPRTNGRRTPMAITTIVRHHSATTSGDWNSFWPHWRDTKGWGTGGYHEIILRDGTLQLCYDPEEITNGVGGCNSYTYHITLVGNGSFTAAQEKTWEERSLFNMKRFRLGVSDIKGHKEMPGANTACPGIDMGMVRNRLQFIINNGPAKEENPQMVSFLKLGDTGEAVKTLQGNLIKAGSKLKVDGSFGPATEAALKAYQNTNKLVPDGLYGPSTRNSLENKVNPKPVPAPTPTKREMYKVQVGAFGVEDNALRLVKELKAKGFMATIIKE